MENQEINEIILIDVVSNMKILINNAIFNMSMANKYMIKYGESSKMRRHLCLIDAAADNMPKLWSYAISLYETQKNEDTEYYIQLANEYLDSLENLHRKTIEMRKKYNF